jgi:hypothetical protein
MGDGGAAAEIHRRGIVQFAHPAWDNDPQLAPYFD